MTQQELADKVGMAKKSIDNIEAGYNRDLSEEKLEKFVFFLNLSADDIKRNADHDEINRKLSINGGYYNAKTKMYSTPMETERLLNRIRDEDGWDRERVSNEIKRCVSGAASFDGVKTFKITPVCIHVPEWQRKTDTVRAREIADSFKRLSYDAVKVWINANGEMVVVDGLHRLYAFIIRYQRDKSEQLKVELVEDATVTEVIDAFVTQGLYRKGTSRGDVYVGALTNGYKVYTDFRLIFMEEGEVQIAEDSVSLGEAAKGTVRTSGAMLNMCAKYPEYTRMIIQFIKECGWNATVKGNPYTYPVFGAMRDIISNYGVDSLKVLRKKAKGPDWFEYNLAGERKGKVYDILANLL